MADSNDKPSTLGATSQLIIALIVVITISVATGLAVHHNDTSAHNHAMMTSQANQKIEIKKAASAAAMKQAEADKMATHEAMMHDSNSTQPAINTAH